MIDIQKVTELLGLSKGCVLTANKIILPKHAIVSFNRLYAVCKLLEKEGYSAYMDAERFRTNGIYNTYDNQCIVFYKGKEEFKLKK